MLLISYDDIILVLISIINGDGTLIARKDIQQAFVSFSSKKASNVTQHLALLRKNCEILCRRLGYDGIPDPFSAANTSSDKFSLQVKKDFIALTMDRSLEIKFPEVTVDKFWTFI